MSSHLSFCHKESAVFDDIFGEKEEPVNYDETGTYHVVAESTLDSLMEITRGTMNVPIIVVMCLSHKETRVGTHTEGEAGIMVATHGRQSDDNNEEMGGGKWYPDIMNVLMELLTNPELLRTIQQNMDAIRAMSQGRGRAINLGALNIDDLKRDLKDGKLPPWMEAMLGDDDDEDEEDE